MLRHLVLLTILFVPAAAPLPEDRRSDLEKIQGEWSLVKQSQAGKAFPLAEKTILMEIKGDEQCYVTMDGRGVLSKFKLDPSKSPKHIDMMVLSPSRMPVRTIRGIYDLAGNRLQICHNKLSKAGVRPVNFTPNDDEVLSEYERIKK